MASPIWATPERCSALALLISPTRAVTRRMDCTTSCMVAPALSTSSEPCATRSTLAEIRPLISRAASALRPARARTSLATTAKPRPCSPARAASTAAFRARMLVWKAMLSITPMMSAIFWLEVLMSRMVSTTCPTTAPPRSATALASRARVLACWALSALCTTASRSSCMEAEVCCSAPAWASVRLDRSMLPCAISVLPPSTFCAPWRTCVTTRASPPCMSFRANSSCATSLRPCAAMGSRRLPAATERATRTAWRKGPVMERMIHQASKPPSTMTTSVVASNMPRTLLAARSVAPVAWPSCCCCCSSRASMALK